MKEENEDKIQSELDKRERLIQTCIVIYGLLLVYNENLNQKTQAISLLIFIIYLSVAMEYYKAIIQPKYTIKKKHINVPAKLLSLLFSCAIIIYAFSILQNLFGTMSGLAISTALGVPIALTMNRALKI